MRQAASAAYDQTAFQDPQDAYIALTRELDQRGIVADVSAAFDAAIQISVGLRPIRLRGHRLGRRRRQTHSPSSTDSADPVLAGPRN